MTQASEPSKHVPRATSNHSQIVSPTEYQVSNREAHGSQFSFKPPRHVLKIMVASGKSSERTAQMQTQDPQFSQVRRTLLNAIQSICNVRCSSQLLEARPRCLHQPLNPQALVTKREQAHNLQIKYNVSEQQRSVKAARDPTGQNDEGTGQKVSLKNFTSPLLSLVSKCLNNMNKQSTP